VTLTGASKLYRRGTETVHALRDVSLEIAPGEMVTLCGPSGCGKSTTLNLLSGVDRADSGAVRVCGIDLVTASDREITLLRRRKIGIVFQSYHLVPHLTLEENVALPLALDGVRAPDRVGELIQRVGLAPRRTHYPSELSGGEQQRTALARALVHKPALVIADEPTGSLDSHSGERVLALLGELRRAEGAALILATHDERIAQAADRVIRMNDGRIVDGA